MKEPHMNFINDEFLYLKKQTKKPYNLELVNKASLCDEPNSKNIFRIRRKPLIKKMLMCKLYR